MVPGQPLASLEEYLPGEGVFVDEERGLLRAAQPGFLDVDRKNKVIRVRPVRRPRMPGPGSTVVGMVTGIRHDLVLVELYGQLELQPRPRWLWEFSGKFSGAIAIGNIANEFIKDIYDYYRVGDIIIARTLNKGNPYHLTTKESRYGVVFAQCSRCGALLEPVNERTMRCPRCGKVEKRKVSILASSRLLQISLRRTLLIPHF